MTREKLTMTLKVHSVMSGVNGRWKLNNTMLRKLKIQSADLTNSLLKSEYILDEFQCIL